MWDIFVLVGYFMNGMDTFNFQSLIYLGTRRT